MRIGKAVQWRPNDTWACMCVWCILLVQPDIKLIATRSQDKCFICVLFNQWQWQPNGTGFNSLAGCRHMIRCDTIHTKAHTKENNNSHYNHFQSFDAKLKKNKINAGQPCPDQMVFNVQARCVCRHTTPICLCNMCSPKLDKPLVVRRAQNSIFVSSTKSKRNITKQRANHINYIVKWLSACRIHLYQSIQETGL